MTFGVDVVVDVRVNDGVDVGVVVDVDLGVDVDVGVGWCWRLETGVCPPS